MAASCCPCLLSPFPHIVAVCAVAVLACCKRFYCRNRPLLPWPFLSRTPRVFISGCVPVLACFCCLFHLGFWVSSPHESPWCTHVIAVFSVLVSMTGDACSFKVFDSVRIAVAAVSAFCYRFGLRDPQLLTISVLEQSSNTVSVAFAKAFGNCKRLSLCLPVVPSRTFCAQSCFFAML